MSRELSPLASDQFPPLLSRLPTTFFPLESTRSSLFSTGPPRSPYSDVAYSPLPVSAIDNMSSSSQSMWATKPISGSPSLWFRDNVTEILPTITSTAGAVHDGSPADVAAQAIKTVGSMFQDIVRVFLFPVRDLLILGRRKKRLATRISSISLLRTPSSSKSSGRPMSPLSHSLSVGISSSILRNSSRSILLTAT